jgi:hypothetical protein
MVRAADDEEYRRALFVRSTLSADAAVGVHHRVADRRTATPSSAIALGPNWPEVPAIARRTPRWRSRRRCCNSMAFRTVYTLARTGLILRANVIDLGAVRADACGAVALRHYGPGRRLGRLAFLNAGLLLGSVWRTVRPPAFTLARQIAVTWAAAALAGVVLAIR